MVDLPKYVDYAVLGEGEETIGELLDYLLHKKGDKEKINGIGYKDEEGKALTFRIAHFGLAANPERIEHMLNISRQFVNERNG